MVWAVSLLSTELISRTLTAGYYVTGIRSLTRFGTDFLRPHRTSALPPVRYVPRGASTPFGENQLAPGSIGISPLYTTHPLIFQHQLVRTSTHFYTRFILVIYRSPGFGSTSCNYKSPLSDSVSLWLRILTP